MEDFFQQATVNLKSLKCAIRQKRVQDAENLLYKLGISSQQLGFPTISSKADELLLWIRSHPTDTLASLTMIFFLCCELQGLRSEWHKSIKASISVPFQDRKPWTSSTMKNFDLET
jgi:hypothetical protein